MNRDKIRDLWWVQALLFGLPFGVVMGLFAAHRHHGSGVADGLVFGAIAGVFFGLGMGAGSAAGSWWPVIGEPPLSTPG